MPNPRDLVRSHLLRALYDLHETGQENEVLDVFLARFAEARPEWSEAQALSNLRYLALKGWAKLGPGRFASISAEGIDLIEGAAALRTPGVSPHVSARDAEGWTLAGDGDAVREAWTEQHRLLGQMLRLVARSDAMPHAAKLDLCATLKALRCLLGHRAPTRAAVEALWREARDAFAASERREGEALLDAKGLARAERLIGEWVEALDVASGKALQEST
jgi:hypothetical protein